MTIYKDALNRTIGESTAITPDIDLVRLLLTALDSLDSGQTANSTTNSFSRVLARLKALDTRENSFAQQFVANVFGSKVN